MDNIARSAASPVEQQSAATGEITHNVEEAAVGAQEVAQTITLVTVAAQESGACAEEVLRSTEDLTRNAEKLSHEVDSFLVKVRTG